MSRRNRLEALKGWSWAPKSDLWEIGYGHLQRYCKAKGNCRVPHLCKTKEGYSLGMWVAKQRQDKDELPAEKRRRLQTLKGWSWEPFSDAWEEGYEHLQRYCGAEGNCLVPQSYKTKDGFRLGVWVATQRRKMETIPASRRLRLERLKGWSWNPVADKWEVGYGNLLRYSTTEGHCLVPATYKTNEGFGLGGWVRTQRIQVQTLSADRRKRLERLKGWVWKVR